MLFEITAAACARRREEAEKESAPYTGRYRKREQNELQLNE